MTNPQPTRRLIEEWLPISEISIEAIRERAGAVPNPAPHQLHVWWARRPLAPSRAAVAASLLLSNAGHSKFLGVLVLQRRLKEGRVGRHEGRLDAWHGSVWPVRCILASPPATAAAHSARTVPGAAFPAPPGRLGAG